MNINPHDDFTDDEYRRRRKQMMLLQRQLDLFEERLVQLYETTTFERNLDALLASANITRGGYEH